MYMRSPCCCTVQDSADGAETRYLNRCELSDKRVTKTEMARERERERETSEARCRRVSRQLSCESTVQYSTVLYTIASVSR